MAEKFDQHAQDDPQVLLHLSQARIELGKITTAVDGLLDLKGRLTQQLGNNGLDPISKDNLEYQLGETLGLLGRSYKQYYINAKPSQKEPREHDLTKSLAYYSDAYERRLGDYLWHGINRVALLNHQERIAKKRSNAIATAAKETASKILEAIDNKKNQGPLQPWDMANRIEANLAIGDTPAAVQATEEYLDRIGKCIFPIPEVPISQG